MVYEKKKSGDPDLDDKQPPEFHRGAVVSAGDGVLVSESVGTVDANGAHVNMGTDAEAGDNRPAPGSVAEAPSEAQIATPVAEVVGDISPSEKSAEEKRETPGEDKPPVRTTRR